MATKMSNHGTNSQTTTTTTANDAQSKPNISTAKTTIPPPLPEPPPMTTLTTSTTTSLLNKQNLLENNNLKNNTTTIHLNGIDDAVVTQPTTIYTKSTNLATRSSIGVQSLRNLWNQRIMANKAQFQLQKQQQQQQHSDKRTQSINSLHKLTTEPNSINAVNNINLNNNNNNNLKFNIRAQSLNDFTKIDLTCVLRERDRLHREKDNFYKYKTAEQAARHSRNDGRRTSNFSLKSANDDEELQQTNNNIPLKNYYSTKIDIKQPEQAPPPPLPPPRALKQRNKLESETDVTNVKPVMPADSVTNSDVSNNENSDLNAEKLVVSVATNMQRRYSFKTHTKCYPLGGKVCKDTGVSGSGNRVARLTERFNALVKNDDTVLDEIKRNNGVLMSRGNHLYKVIENTDRNKCSPFSSRVQHQIKHFEVQVNKTKPNLDAIPVETENIENSKEICTDIEAKSKQRKQKYAKIYEKFRIRSPFTSPKNKNNKSKLKQETETVVESNIMNLKEKTTDESLTKILTALQEVDEKLKCLNIEEISSSSLLSLHENDDFEQVVVPNSSFLHQSHKIEHNNSSITQAVNITLVNNLNSKNEIAIITEEEIDSKQRNVMENVEPEDSVYEPIADLKFNNEDIYQTLKEVVNNKQEIADDYESIEETQDHAILLYNGSNDSYESLEICPAAAPPPTQAIPTLYTQLSRNTNDELPEIPKPKRRLPKSPMPGKRISKTILPSKVYRHSFYESETDKDNIYCTIKTGKHCYESVSTVAQDLQPIMYVKTTDTISLKSNGYERIQNFRCNATNSHNKYASSHCGSTLTISSDHKTNSLYEPSLAASLLHGGSLENGQLDVKSSSNHHDRLSVCSILSNSTIICEAIPGSRCGSTDGSTLACGNYSLLNMAASDNSDDWIDMTDTDDASSYAKITAPQFIV